jgi:hypothetical protein
LPEEASAQARHWSWDRHTHRGSGAAALLGAGVRTDSAPLPPGGVPGSGLHFRLSAAPDPDLQLRPAPPYSQVTDGAERPMGGTLGRPTSDAGGGRRRGGRARTGDDGTCSLQPWEKQVAAWHLYLGWSWLRAGRGPARPADRVPTGGWWRSTERGQKTLYTELGREKYDVNEYAHMACEPVLYTRLSGEASVCTLRPSQL